MIQKEDKPGSDSLKNILISIITVVYNAEKYLEDSIQSVINQNYKHIQYILVDGGSTDRTVDIIKKYEGNISLWVSEPDNGIYDAMNKGLKMAQGDWVLFLGADDVLFNDNVITDVVASCISPDVIYYGNALFKSSSKLYNVDISRWFLSLRNISHQTAFYPQTVYKNYPYDLNYRLFSDHIYNIKLFAENKYQFAHIPVTTVLYNDAGSSSEGNDPNYFKDLPKIVRKYLGNRYALYVYMRLKIFNLKRKILNR